MTLLYLYCPWNIFPDRARARRAVGLGDLTGESAYIPDLLVASIRFRLRISFFLTYMTYCCYFLPYFLNSEHFSSQRIHKRSLYFLIFAGLVCSTIDIKIVLYALVKLIMCSGCICTARPSSGVCNKVCNLERRLLYTFHILTQALQLNQHNAPALHSVLL